MSTTIGEGANFQLGTRVGPGGRQVFTLSAAENAFCPCHWADLELSDGDALAVAIGILGNLKSRGFQIGGFVAKARSPKGRASRKR